MHMRVFVTGATGFIGSAIVQELIGAGHKVLGLSRNDDSAKALAKLKVEAHQGDLKDTDSLAAGAKACDGVIHTAFLQDFSDMAGNSETDKRAVEAMGAALAGSNRPFVIASPTAVVMPGKPATEDTAGSLQALGAGRVPSEEAMIGLASKGVRTSIVRLPPAVHDREKQGLISMMIPLAKEKGVSAYVNDGLNRWAAVHRLDAARLFRLALEKGSAGARYHAVGEEGVPLRDIAKNIGQHLNLPIVGKTSQEAAEHFGWLAYFVGADLPASSAQTQKLLGWRPTHPGLLVDLDRASAFEDSKSKILARS
jgi:nucleoside-diphosphate-sugar epimerase